MKRLEKEMKRTEALVYQMIPKAIALKLKNGEPAMNTCKVGRMAVYLNLNQSELTYSVILPYF